MLKKQDNGFRTQVYDVGDGVTVTIRFPADKRPKMVHLDTVAIIGQHACGPTQRAAEPFASAPPGDSRPQANFEVSADDPAYLAFRERAHAAQHSEFGPPAPADYSPPVVTSEQILADAGIDLRGKQLSIGGLASVADDRGDA